MGRVLGLSAAGVLLMARFWRMGIAKVAAKEAAA
jgi:hypothetical protein